MRDELTTGLDLFTLWNAALAAMAQGFALPGRGRALAEVTAERAAPDKPTFVAATVAGQIYLQPRDLPFAALTQSTLDADAVASLPPALGEQVWAIAAQRVLAAGGDALRAVVQGLTRCDPADMTGEEHLLLRIDGGWGAVAEVLVQADRLTLIHLARGVIPGAGRGQWPEAIAAQVTVPCGLRLGGPTVPLARLHGLVQGDLVLSSGPQPWLCAPHARFGLSHDGTNWTIGEVSMTDDLPAMEPGPTAMAGDIGDVPVRLSILLAETTLKLSDLQGLTHGALLPFVPNNPEAGQTARLLANGRPIGEGQIVEVDGIPALRVTRLFGK